MLDGRDEWIPRAITGVLIFLCIVGLLIAIGEERPDSGASAGAMPTVVPTPTRDAEMAAVCREFEDEIEKAGYQGFTAEEIVLYLLDYFTDEELERLMDRCIEVLEP